MRVLWLCSPAIESAWVTDMALSVTHLRSPVSHLVTRPAVSVSASDALASVGQVMRSNNVSAVLVGPGHSAIATEHDLARAVAESHPLSDPIVEVATPRPVSVDADTDVVDAAALMLNQDVRHLIVEFEGEPLGLVSIREIMAALLQAAKPELWMSSLRMKLEIPSDAWWG